MSSRKQPEPDPAAPAELGPAIPEGQDAPEPTASGKPVKGVQPVEADQIPESGR